MSKPTNKQRARYSQDHCSITCAGFTSFPARPCTKAVRHSQSFGYGFCEVCVKRFPSLYSKSSLAAPKLQALKAAWDQLMDPAISDEEVEGSQDEVIDATTEVRRAYTLWEQLPSFRCPCIIPDMPDSLFPDTQTSTVSIEGQRETVVWRPCPSKTLFKCGHLPGDSPVCDKQLCQDQWTDCFQPGEGTDQGTERFKSLFESMAADSSTSLVSLQQQHSACRKIIIQWHAKNALEVRQADEQDPDYQAEQAQARANIPKPLAIPLLASDIISPPEHPDIIRARLMRQRRQSSLARSAQRQAEAKSEADRLATVDEEGEGEVSQQQAPPQTPAQLPDIPHASPSGSGNYHMSPATKASMAKVAKDMKKRQLEDPSPSKAAKQRHQS